MAPETELNLYSSNCFFGGQDALRGDGSAFPDPWMWYFAVFEMGKFFPNASRRWAERLGKMRQDPFKYVLDGEVDVGVFQEAVPFLWPLPENVAEGISMAIGYQGDSRHFPTETAAAIISRIPGKQDTRFCLPGDNGGSCVFHLLDWEFTIFGVHFSSVRPDARRRQFAYLAQAIQTSIDSGRCPIIAGDLNCRPQDVSEFADFMGMTVYGYPSYPSRRVMEAVNASPWKRTLRLAISRLAEMPRALDYILAPKNVKVETQQIETLSDHDAIAAQISLP